MKKIIILLMVFSLMKPISSQVLRKSIPINIQTTEKNISQLKASSLSHNVIWTDDFSSAENWVISNDVDNYQNWKITSYNPLGFYSSGLGKIDSDTPNKYALMDADLVGNGEDMQRAKLTNVQPINCSTNEKVYIKFDSYYAKKSSKMYLRVSNDNQASWTDFEIHDELPEWFATANPEKIRLDISHLAAGYENVFIQFYYDGLDENWGLAWMVDDVEIYEPNGLDADIVSIDCYWYIGNAEDFELKTTLQNMGAEVINSITLNYKIGDFESSDATIDNLQIQPFQTFQITHPETYKIDTTGNFEPTFTITQINGTNFTLTGEAEYIEVFNNINTKAIQCEVFTSATCIPCAGFNPTFDYVQKYVSPNLMNTIKYQMNWPENGDKYYTQEGETRKTFYDVNSVPSLYMNGTNVNLNEFGFAYIRNLLEQPAEVSIGLAGTVNNSTIDIKLDLLSSRLLNDFYLFVSVNEKQTHKNTGSNGETEFNHVMMKMLSSAEGIDLSNLIVEENKIFDFSYDMSSTNVEELNNLEVVAFVQNKITKEIIQSKSLDLSWQEQETVSIEKETENAVNIYPNPASEFIAMDCSGKCNLIIYNKLGAEVYRKEHCSSNQVIDVSNFRSGLYFISTKANDKVEVQKIIISK